MKIAVAGASGRMGRALVRAVHDAADATLVGASERPGSEAVGRDVGELAGLAAPLNIAASASPADAARDAGFWIDFTTPAATLSALEALKHTGVRAAIIGTTGFSPAEETALAAAAERFALVRSGNFSLGINLLAALTEQTAKRLGKDWDIEIVEAHHRHKKDAPSGTALLLGQAAAAGRGALLSELALPPHHGETGARPEGGVGFAVIRAGGIVGEHDVVFASEREIITLSHQALDRGLFADGALAATRWVQDKPPGLYSMRDVLDL
jgi:4-hydroxy-tetrahydrodipicolinate reductase